MADVPTTSCPRCGRACERVDHPSSVPHFVCDNCERGDGADPREGLAVAKGPFVFTADDAPPTAEVPIDWAAVAAEVEADLVRLRADLKRRRDELLALDRHIGNGEVALRYALQMAEEECDRASALAREVR